jgi:hypothetical protein
MHLDRFAVFGRYGRFAKLPGFTTKTCQEGEEAGALEPCGCRERTNLLISWPPQDDLS